MASTRVGRLARPVGGASSYRETTGLSADACGGGAAREPSYGHVVVPRPSGSRLRRPYSAFAALMKPGLKERSMERQYCSAVIFLPFCHFSDFLPFLCANVTVTGCAVASCGRMAVGRFRQWRRSYPLMACCRPGTVLRGGRGGPLGTTLPFDSYSFPSNGRSRWSIPVSPGVLDGTVEPCRPGWCPPSTGMSSG